MTENAMLNDFLQNMAIICTRQNQQIDITRDEILTRKEVCERLKVSNRVLTNWIKADKFPAPIIIGNKEQRWPSSIINQRIYEDNPHLRKDDEIMADAISVVDQMEAVA